MNHYFESLKAVFRSFPLKVQALILGLALLVAIGLLGLLTILNQSFLVPVAASGGSLTEGVIGTPRFINPLLAVSDADRDLTALVYSGLMRIGPNGKPIPDLAESYQISEDGLVYTFTLRRDLTWQDGKDLTAEDVEFTINKAQDPQIKSVRRASWEGVRVERASDREISFHLKQPYAQFLDITTMGILPKHLWKSVEPEAFALSELNLKSAGSGPYAITAIKKASDGLPLYYELAPFKDFALGQAKIASLIFRFYPGEAELTAALKKGEVQSAAALPPATIKDLELNADKVKTAPLPRVFAIFFNQNEAPLFALSEVRLALSQTVPRAAVIDEVLKGYGIAIDGPLPSGALGYEPATQTAADLVAATDTLTKAGWKKNASGIWEKKNKKGSQTLSFRLATTGTPELKATAELVAQAWRSFGAAVSLDVFEIGDLNQNVIRPRQYQALFFGEIVGTNPDPFAFWHSSQRLDPGLNVAMYANSSVDKLLTEARSLSAETDRKKKLLAFNQEIKKDNPAAFIYTPSFIYVIPTQVNKVTLNGLTTSADRLAQIYNWYVNTEKVWPLFANQ